MGRVIAQRVAKTAQILVARVLVAVALVGGFGLALHLYLLATLQTPDAVSDPEAPVTAAPDTATVQGPQADVVPPLAPLAGRVMAGAHAFPLAAAGDYGPQHHDYPATDLFADCGTPDDGVRYYGSHLAEVAVGPGQRVRAGEVLGTVGETGSAAGTGCHLHLGLSPGECGPGDWFTRRGAVSPYPLLQAWGAGQDADPVPAVREWLDTYGCPTEPTVYP